MNIAIVDDEMIARAQLKRLLLQADDSLCIWQASDCREIYELVESQKLDACFVDIDLDGEDGLVLAEKLRAIQSHMQIVFATAHPEYMGDAFDVGAIDYITKPFEKERVAKTLKRLERIARTIALARESGRGEASNTIQVLQSGGGLIRISVKDIVYVEYKERSCYIYTREHCFVQHRTLDSFEQELQCDLLVRVSRYYIINVNHIISLHRSSKDDYVLELDGLKQVQIPVSRSKQTIIKEAMRARKLI